MNNWLLAVGGSHKGAVEEASQEAEDSSLSKRGGKAKGYDRKTAGQVAHDYHRFPPESVTCLSPGEGGNELSSAETCCLHHTCKPCLQGAYLPV